MAMMTSRSNRLYEGRSHEGRPHLPQRDEEVLLMAKDPAVLFYTSDFLIGVSDMPFLDRGYYITLLCLQHQKGHLSEETICFSLGLDSVSQIQRVMEKFDRDENGLYYQHRMELETQKRAAFTESRRKNGEKGGRPTQKHAKDKNHIQNHMDNHMGNHMENENENENIDQKESKKAQIPYEKIRELFNTLCPSFSRVLGISGKRKIAVAARWKEHPELNFFTDLFKRVEASDFLKGKNDRNWKATFDWLMNAANMDKVREGKYDTGGKKHGVNREPAGASNGYSLSGFKMATGDENWGSGK